MLDWLALVLVLVLAPQRTGTAALSGEIFAGRQVAGAQLRNSLDESVCFGRRNDFQIESAT